MVPERITPTPAVAGGLDVAAIGGWLVSQRWFASKSRVISQLELEDGARVSPALLILLVHARFADEPGERYQLPLTLLARSEVGDRTIVSAGADRVAVDAVADAELARELLRAIASDAEVSTATGAVRFRRSREAEPLPLDAPARPIGVEQSNSSIVFGDETVLKVFRRLEPGVSPELEMVRFLSLRDFASIAPLQGYYEYDDGGEPITLGVAQRFFADARDGWTMTLSEIGGDPGELVDRLGALGEVTAELHNALTADSRDPAFAPETPEPDFAARLGASVQDEIATVFARLPADERTAPIVGRGADLLAELQRRSRDAAGGRLIRTHGDYHLGQTLYRDAGWVIIDFEGEPARSLAERRRKTSPLRDVAGMLRSFAYVSAAAEQLGAEPAPAGFERRVRAAFMERYLAHVDPALVPAQHDAIEHLLSIYELEKAVYELAYELDHRPAWLPIPVAGVARLLEDS